jgi:3-hydroxyisobutyrate dehydrogenase-like beta-hydroxyacid dehydrogenase
LQGLLYGYKAGLNLEDVIATVSQGAAGSASLNLYGLRILQGNYVRNFSCMTVKFDDTHALGGRQLSATYVSVVIFMHRNRAFSCSIS